MGFELDVNNFQQYKLMLHLAQSFLTAIAWIIEIVVFRKASTIDGRPGWYFGLVSCSA
jgi:hypothetical protein